MAEMINSMMNTTTLVDGAMVATTMARHHSLDAVIRHIWLALFLYSAEWLRGAVGGDWASLALYLSISIVSGPMAGARCGVHYDYDCDRNRLGPVQFWWIQFVIFAATHVLAVSREASRVSLVCSWF